MDAPRGHENLWRVVEGTTTSNKIVTGDQNATKNKMKDHCSGMEIDSVGSADPLIHPVAAQALGLEPIDLGATGSVFKNKGATDCSEHQPQAFSVAIPGKK